MIVLGRITAPFGVKGWVRIHPFADDPPSWLGMTRWWLAEDADVAPEAWREVEILAARVHGESVIAQIAEVCDRSAAEGLEGLYVGAPRDAMPATGPGEYYWADLVGLAVVNETGDGLGVVERLLETGANDVLVVRDGRRERLLPFVDAVVKVVDVVGQRITVDWQVDW